MIRLPINNDPLRGVALSNESKCFECKNFTCGPANCSYAEILLQELAQKGAKVTVKKCGVFASKEGSGMNSL